ncbi:MAG TPA: hypothetical protein DCM09_02895 [Butyricimonas virosa]|jgi:hypothetical protein|nr:hypothetical protein [Butyricimonas virosa]
MGVASAIMKKATPRRYKYNSEKNIRVTNVSVATIQGMIIFDLLQVIVSIFSCLLSYIDVVLESSVAF